MGDWKRMGEVFSDAKLAVLGGKTLVENWSAAQTRWMNGGGHEGLPYGPHHAGLWPPGWKPANVPKQQPPPRALAPELPMHLTRVGVPSRLSQVLESGTRETSAVRAVREWSSAKQSFLLLHGDVGGGKSVAAASAFLHRKRLSWKDGQPEWDSDGAFVDAAELATGLFTDDGKELLKFVETTGLLVMDELGSESRNQAWLSALENLLNRRFNDPKLRTVIATNLSASRPLRDEPSPFEAAYGARVARRIRESGTVCHVTHETLASAKTLGVEP